MSDKKWYRVAVASSFSVYVDVLAGSSKDAELAAEEIALNMPSTKPITEWMGPENQDLKVTPFRGKEELVIQYNDLDYEMGETFAVESSEVQN